MKPLILTSTGFSNPAFCTLFLQQIGKPADRIRVLFIPTAAIDDDAKAMVPECKRDLTEVANIPEENITVYDLDASLTDAQIAAFDAIYVCGGTTAYLAKRMSDICFGKTLLGFLAAGGVYLGVSAGSVLMAAGYENGLGLAQVQQIHVHVDDGSPMGAVEPNTIVRLTNAQALLVWEDGRMEVVG